MLIIPANVLRELRPNSLILTTRVMGNMMIGTFITDHFGSSYEVSVYNRSSTQAPMYVINFHEKQDVRHVAAFLLKNKQISGAFIA